MEFSIKAAMELYILSSCFGLSRSSAAAMAGTPKSTVDPTDSTIPLTSPTKPDSAVLTTGATRTPTIGILHSVLVLASDAHTLALCSAPVAWDPMLEMSDLSILGSTPIQHVLCHVNVFLGEGFCQLHVPTRFKFKWSEL